jgi:alpha/beta superfamily hydrolase
LNFIGKGNGIFSDAMREHSDAKSIIEYLTIPKKDLLAYEFRSAEAFRPSYFIAKDRYTNSVVLSIRGTMVKWD